MTTLAENCIAQQIKALQNLYSVITTEVYVEILDIITELTINRDSGRRLILAGVGKNANIATKISETMASLGIPTFYLNISHCGHGDYGFINKNDVIIHVSRSGKTREMLEVIEHVKLILPTVKQILIHCNDTKPANSTLDLELFIGSVVEGDEFGLAPTTSTTALLCLLDSLAVEASHRAGFAELDFLKNHPDGALGERLKAKLG